MPGASRPRSALPVIADADTGYGNELNVVRTVREYEAAGVAGIHIEDQGFPKKCGHLDDKEIVPREDWLAKIRAAAAVAPQPRLHGHRAHRFARRRRLRRGDRRAPTRRSRPAPTWRLSRRRRPWRRSRRCRAWCSGPCLLNVVHGGKTPEIDLARGRADGLQAGDRAGPVDQERRRHLRADARRSWPRPAAIRRRCAR